MKVHEHFLINLIAGTLFLKLTGQTVNTFNLTPFLAAGVLVDFDHPLTYIIRIKQVKAKTIIQILDDYKYNRQHLYLFHTIEFALFLTYLTFKTILPLTFLAGYFTHLLADGARHQIKKKNFSWLRKWSLCLNFLR
jgi:hypothetical protein